MLSQHALALLPMPGSWGEAGGQGCFWSSSKEWDSSYPPPASAMQGSLWDPEDLAEI